MRTLRTFEKRVIQLPVPGSHGAPELRLLRTFLHFCDGDASLVVKPYLQGAPDNTKGPLQNSLMPDTNFDFSIGLDFYSVQNKPNHPQRISKALPCYNLIYFIGALLKNISLMQHYGMGKTWQCPGKPGLQMFPTTAGEVPSISWTSTLPKMKYI